LGDTSLPGVQSVISQLKSQGTLSPVDFVNGCLDAIGPLDVSEMTYDELLTQAKEGGDLVWDTPQEIESSERRVGIVLALIAASRDYQFA
jgi:hypothetical protein